MFQSTLYLGAGWLLYRLALRQERCFDYNRRYLLLLPVLAALLPLLELPALWTTALSGGILSTTVVQLPAVVVNPSVLDAWFLSQWPWLQIVYGMGVVALLVRLGWQLLTLRHSIRQLPREARPGYVLVRTGGQLPVSSFGNLIFWDETIPLSDTEANHILRHELAHVRQGHTWERLALEVLRAGLWFNPFAHLLPRALELTHEYLADEEAMSAVSAPAYAALLARQAAARLGFAAILTHPFVQSFTLNRIAMLHRTSPIRRWKQWLALPLVALLTFTVACEQSTESVAPPKGASSQNAAVLPPPPAPETEPIRPALTNHVYNSVEEMPSFPTGNNNDIVAYIQSKIKYPAEAVRNKVKGKVIISFVIDKEGNVTDILIEKGIGSGCDQAALNAVRQLPRFAPGRQDGQPVAVRFVVPIQFEPYSAPVSNLLGSLGGSPKC